MSNVQVKHIPEDLHEQLRARAAQQGTTISAYVLELIRRDLRRPDRKEWIAQVLATPKLDLPRDDVLRSIDAARHERDDHQWNRHR